jgi:predicted GIY-YIG superfamily endonuclease
VGKYYLDYLNNLISDGIVETNNRYIAGKTSKGYRYTSVYNDSELIRYDFTDKHISKKLSEESKVKEAVKKKYSYLYKWFASGKLTIDSDAAFKLIKSHNLSEALKYSVGAIQSGIWRFKVSGEGKRLYTNLTNLKRELRQFLRYDGKELVELDIKSSQPYFFIKLIVVWFIFLGR